MNTTNGGVPIVVAKLLGDLWINAPTLTTARNDAAQHPHDADFANHQGDHRPRHCDYRVKHSQRRCATLHIDRGPHLHQGLSRPLPFDIDF